MGEDRTILNWDHATLSGEICVGMQVFDRESKSDRFNFYSTYLSLIRDQAKLTHIGSGFLCEIPASQKHFVKIIDQIF